MVGGSGGQEAKSLQRHGLIASAATERPASVENQVCPLPSLNSDLPSPLQVSPQNLPEKRPP